MRLGYCVCALFLAALFAAPPAMAREKAKAPKQSKLYDFNWGRRRDITQRFWPLHQHPYVRIP
jgi:hypothetical protein